METHRSPGAVRAASRLRRLLLVLVSAALAAGCDRSRDEERSAPGEEPTQKTDVLKAGAELIQDNEPARELDVHLVGFHPDKEQPFHQMEAHHFCNQVNEDFAQCALFDGGGDDARLSGIEYIISERLFEQLPEEEKAYWHPHNYEILSGQLVAPGLPGPAELELMRGKMNSYGKTWHTWRTKTIHGPGDALPLGPPSLAWSFNADGEAAPALVQQRDRELDIDGDEVREARRELLPLARPQRGVDALAEHFRGRKKPPGIAERRSTARSDQARDHQGEGAGGDRESGEGNGAIAGNER